MSEDIINQNDLYEPIINEPTENVQEYSIYQGQKMISRGTFNQMNERKEIIHIFQNYVNNLENSISQQEILNHAKHAKSLYENMVFSLIVFNDIGPEVNWWKIKYFDIIRTDTNISTKFIKNVEEKLRLKNKEDSMKYINSFPKIKNDIELKKLDKNFENLLALKSFFELINVLGNKKINIIKNNNIINKKKANEIEKIKNDLNEKFMQEKSLLITKYININNEWEDDWELLNEFNEEHDKLKIKFQEKINELNYTF